MWVSGMAGHLGDPADKVLAKDKMAHEQPQVLQCSHLGCSLRQDTQPDKGHLGVVLNSDGRAGQSQTLEEDTKRAARLRKRRRAWRLTCGMWW